MEEKYAVTHVNYTIFIEHCVNTICLLYNMYLDVIV